MLFSNIRAEPQGPDEILLNSNQTAASVAGKMLNISGGYIADINLSATIQNPRWKGIVGLVTGMFTLDDASGSSIYDWTLASITGRIYTSRNDSGINWAGIRCANLTTLDVENFRINHTNANDNITATFNVTSGATHNPFFVGAIPIGASSCPTLNTYVDNSTQDNFFEEVALYDGNNIIYAAILEEAETGFNGKPFDFQLIVPENGAATFTGATAYYIYLEIGY